jgi:hypothetical protein
MPRPQGLRPAEEVVPKLGAKPGNAVLRVGDVATYDRILEHLSGQCDRLDLDLPLRSPASRYGLVLCFALEPVDLRRLCADLIRVTNPQGRIWVVVWKKGFVRGGAPSWDALQEAMLETDWVDNKILSFGDQCYGTQYVLRKARRPQGAAG